MAEAPESSGSPILTQEEVLKCHEIALQISNELEETSTPIKRITSEVAKDLFVKIYRNWKTEKTEEEGSFESSTEEPPLVEGPSVAPSPTVAQPKRPSRLSRLCTYIRKEIKEWRSKESQVTDENYIRNLKRLDTTELLIILTEKETEIRNHIITSDEDEAAHERCLSFSSELNAAVRETYDKGTSPANSEEDGTYFMF